MKRWVKWGSVKLPRVPIGVAEPADNTQGEKK